MLWPATLDFEQISVTVIYEEIMGVICAFSLLEQLVRAANLLAQGRDYLMIYRGPSFLSVI